MEVRNHSVPSSQFTPTGQQAPINKSTGFSPESRITSANQSKSCADYFWGLVDWMKGLINRFLDCILCRKQTKTPPQPTGKTTTTQPAATASRRLLEKQKNADATNAALANIEPVSKWLTPYFPHFKKAWAKMDDSQKNAFFQDVLRRGYPITSKAEAIGVLNWIKANLGNFAFMKGDRSMTRHSLEHLITECGGDLEKYKSDEDQLDLMIDDLIALQDKSNVLYKQASLKTLTGQITGMKTPREGFTIGPVVANTTPPQITFIQPEKTPHFIDYRFTPEAHSMCSAFALSRSAAEGKLYSTQEVMQKVADERRKEDQKNDLSNSIVMIPRDSFTVLADKKLFDDLYALKPIQSTTFVSSKVIKTWSAEKEPNNIHLLGSMQGDLANFPLEYNKEDALFVALLKNA